MRFKSILVVALICAAGAVLPLWAHHSHGNYEGRGVGFPTALIAGITGNNWKRRSGESPY